MDDSDDDEDVIRKMAARATMHRRPTIALALMSSSEEEMNFDSARFTNDPRLVESYSQSGKDIYLKTILR